MNTKCFIPLICSLEKQQRFLPVTLNEIKMINILKSRVNFLLINDHNYIAFKIRLRDIGSKRWSSK